MRRLKTSAPSCADFLEILTASTSWNPQGLSRPVQRLLHLRFEIPGAKTTDSTVFQDATPCTFDTLTVVPVKWKLSSSGDTVPCSEGDTEAIQQDMSSGDTVPCSEGDTQAIRQSTPFHIPQDMSSGDTVPCSEGDIQAIPQDMSPHENNI